MCGLVKKIPRSQRGQTLVELTLIFPLMLLLAYGAIEVGSVISTYLTITHTSREGANLVSRGETPETMLQAILASSAPTIRRGANEGQWKIIYSQITQRAEEPCDPSCTYEISLQIDEGDFPEGSKIGVQGEIANATLSQLNEVAPWQIFHVVEVYYDYTPNVMTFVGRNFLNRTFYDRTIFTDVSGQR